MKRVLKEATRLGLLGVEDDLRAVDFTRLDLPPLQLRDRAFIRYLNSDKAQEAIEKAIGVKPDEVFEEEPDPHDK